MNRQKHRIRLWLIVFIIPQAFCAVHLDAMCLLRNRNQPGQVPIATVQQPTWQTLAGYPGMYGTNDGWGPFASFQQPSAIAPGRSNQLFVTDGSAVREISPDGTVRTVAGSLALGYQDGPRATALFAGLTALAADTDGNIFLADQGGNVVRKISSDGFVSTIAGKAMTNGYADGIGTNALFAGIEGVALGVDGSLYVVDSGNQVIRKIMPDGVVSTIAGNPGTSGWQDGMGTNALFNNPLAIAADGTGNFYISDSSIVRQMTADGRVTTVAGGPTSDWQDGNGTNAFFNFPTGLAVDESGNLYVADGNNYCIRKVTPAGDVSTIAGVPANPGYADGPALIAQFQGPGSLALSGDRLFVADIGNVTIRRAGLAPGPAVEFVTQPLSAVVPPGTNAVFQVVASGAGLLTYQWFSGDGDFDGTDEPIPGATNSALVLSNSENWAGYAFRVAVSDGSGYILSQPASLQIAEGAPSAAPSGPFGNWHLLASQQITSLADVAYGNGRFVAAGMDISGNASILESPDGIQWTTQPLGALNGSPLQPLSLAFGHGVFVITSSGGVILTSADGLAWKSHTLTPLAAHMVQSVTFDQGMFLAVTSDDNGSLWSSPDGVTWTNIGFEVERHFQNVIAGGGRFVAVGNTILISSNGLDWQPAQLPDGFAGDYGSFNSVAYGNGLYVLIGGPIRQQYNTCGRVSLLLSGDGSIWVDVTPTNSLSLAQITFGDGRFVAIDSGSGGITYSTDGINWSAPALISDLTNHVTYAEALWFCGGIFIAEGRDDSGNTALVTSADGIAWTEMLQHRTLPIDAFDYAFALINAGGNYVGFSDYRFLLSTNGSDWTFQPSFTENYYDSLAYGAGVVVAVGGNWNGTSDSDAIAVSGDNGGTWVERSFNGTVNDSDSLYEVTFGTNGFVAVGSANNAAHILISPNAQTWQRITLPATGSLYHVAYGNGAYVAISANIIITSSNAVNWQKTFSAPNTADSTLAFGNGRFVVGASSNGVPLALTSPDGIAWTRHPLVGAPVTASMVFGSGYFLQADYSGNFYSSSDGVTWNTSFTSFGWDARLFAGEGVFLALISDPNGVPIGLYQSDPIERLDPPLPLPGGQFGLNVTGARHLDYEVQVSDDLQTWVAIGSASNSLPAQSFIDSGANGHTNRFYRVLTH
jgi:NHL repeat